MKKISFKEKVKKINPGYLFSLPYVLLFAIFIITPIIIAIVLSFTNYNGVGNIKFIGFSNYTTLFTMDQVFMQKVIPNTLKFGLVVGVFGYLLSFAAAWALAQITKRARTVLAIILYTPTLTLGIAMAVIWRTFFSGDANGYLNAFLISIGTIDAPIAWLTDGKYLLVIMIIVSLWSSMGVGFLSMLSGILNINPELYEAAYVDGLKNRWQEIFYLTIPSMKPQMLFGAVMAVVNSFTVSAIGVQLSGANPTPQNAGQLIVNHIDDYGFGRFEMGYAAAISVVLLIFMYLLSKVIYKILGEKN